ncbi:MAG: HlyD family type I secretion periplasmic adaptor subunit [Rhodocyclaceae bacterium]|nr:HlyD family type I secretion periplasmic adaptor subunit [Rhodocyclaceae bacterium]
MEPADQPHLKPSSDTTEEVSGAKAASEMAETAIEFLPDADEIERRPLPQAARMTLYALGVMVLMFLIWASVSEVDRIVVARGRLVTPLSNLVVMPLETSIIQSIDVRIGQVVKKGQVLATLDPTFTTSDLAQLRQRVQSLDTQARRLESELAGGKGSTGGKDQDSNLQARLHDERQANYKAQLAKMDETVARIKAGIETNRHDQQVLDARVQSLTEIEAMQEKLLAQQFGSKARLLEAREKRLEVERDLHQARNKAAELRRELAAAEADRAAFIKGWRQKTMEELLTTQRDRDTASEQMQKADKRSKLVTMTAPADSVVLEIAKRSAGSVVKEAEPMFTLVPIDAELEAEVQIDSGDIGYVKLGDASRIKFDAYPFQQHGTVDGEVRTLTEDSFRRDSAAAIAAASAQGQGGDSYFLGRVSLNGTRLKRMDPKARLLPGMTVTAEIVVGKRTVISYLLWPLTKAMDEAIREP